MTTTENARQETSQQHVETRARRAQIAATKLRTVSTSIKNNALDAMAESLVARQQEIFAANALDLETGRAQGLSTSLLDRLRLDAMRVAAMADGCRQVAALPDPVGEIVQGKTLPNGLKLSQVRVPLGVIGVVYESRPNVTVDAAILALKAGNAVILRGGKEALNSNLLLTQIIAQAALDAGAPADCIQSIETMDRAATEHLVTLNGLIDLVIPRGGEGLKKALGRVATVPLIYAAAGNCHIFVDESADLQMASDIVFNAKVQRPSTCNAVETLLVHRAIAPQFLPSVSKRLCEANVELRGDEQARAFSPIMTEATEEDWDTEFLSLTLAVRVVDDVDAAIQHIETHGSSHSEAIITQDYANAEKFLNGIDSAALYVNASTRFTDGFEFGLGAEVGISTQKLHARGPMGLESLTSTKYIVRGQGQIRG